MASDRKILHRKIYVFPRTRWKYCTLASSETVAISSFVVFTEKQISQRSVAPSSCSFSTATIEMYFLPGQTAVYLSTKLRQSGNVIRLTFGTCISRYMFTHQRFIRGCRAHVELEPRITRVCIFRIICSGSYYISSRARLSYTYASCIETRLECLRRRFRVTSSVYVFLILRTLIAYSNYRKK